MRNKYFFIAILLFALNNGYSQSSQDKEHFSLSIGPSFPIGDYANKDVSSKSSGIAKTGQVINIAYTRLLQKQSGIAVTVHGQRNPVNTKTFENYLDNTGFPNWKMEKASWLFSSLLFGGYCQFPVAGSGGVLFTTKATIGAVYAKSPELNGASKSSTHSGLIEQTSVSAFGLSYLLNAGINYHLNNKIFLLGEAEYFGTPKLKFKNVKSTFRSATFTSNGFPISAQEQSSTTDGKQAISSINLNFGIGLRL